MQNLHNFLCICETLFSCFQCRSLLVAPQMHQVRREFLCVQKKKNVQERVVLKVQNEQSSKEDTWTLLLQLSCIGQLIKNDKLPYSHGAAAHKKKKKKACICSKSDVISATLMWMGPKCCTGDVNVNQLLKGNDTGIETRYTVDEYKMAHSSDVSLMACRVITGFIGSSMANSGWEVGHNHLFWLQHEGGGGMERASDCFHLFRQRKQE